MEDQDFSIITHVSQSPNEVFKTLLNVRSWWYGLFDESFDGSSSGLGDEFSFKAGAGAHFTRQKLVELEPDKKISWLVTEANLSFVDNTTEWEGTKISFELNDNGAGTEIVFIHQGLKPKFECYDACSSAWTQYILERLPKVLKDAE